MKSLKALLCAAVLAGCARTVDVMESPPLTAAVPAGRLLYVAHDPGSDAPFRIELLDLGMATPRVLAQSREALASPRWSPDGTQFAYVGHENGHAALFLQAASGAAPRRLLGDTDAIGAPAWSPDGQKLAFSMSADGSTDVFVLDLTTQTVARLTQEPGAETDPAFAPDGRSLVMTSDRAGTPQLYDFSLKRLRSRALLPEAEFSAMRASYSPDGHSLVFVKHDGDGDSIELLDLDSQQLTPLSEGPQDAAPAFSPDGAFVAYTAHADGHAIELVSADGRVRQSLRTAGEVREPSWTRSP